MVFFTILTIKDMNCHDTVINDIPKYVDGLAWVPGVINIIFWLRSIHPVLNFQCLILDVAHHQNSKYYTFPYLNDVLFFKEMWIKSY